MTYLITAQSRRSLKAESHPDLSIAGQKGHQLSLFIPLYDSSTYWDLEPVPLDESLPGQRYRLVLIHGRLSRAIPVQLRPIEGTQLLDAVEKLQCNWALDLDGNGQILDDEARSALALLFEALLGGSL